MKKNTISIKFSLCNTKDAWFNVPNCNISFGNYHPSFIGKHFNSTHLGVIAYSLVRNTRKPILDVIVRFCKEVVEAEDIYKRMGK